MVVDLYMYMYSVHTQSSSIKKIFNIYIQIYSTIGDHQKLS